MAHSLSWLTGNHLNDLRHAFYDDQSETTCRIAIDIILIQCRKYLRCKQHPAESSTASLATPSTPQKAGLDVPTKQRKLPVKFYPEPTVSVEIADPFNPNRKYLVSGRADWAMGYSPNGEDGALFIAVEAKQRATFGAGESQLLAYLAILRENGRRAGKINTMAQGFYSDGDRFVFACVRNDGTVLQSLTWETRSDQGLTMLFNFFVDMLETAMKSTPTVTPTKPGIEQDREIQNFDGEVWAKVYSLMDALLVIEDGDENASDVIDMSSFVISPTTAAEGKRMAS